MYNHFCYAPTVGSHDTDTSNDDLFARLNQLEQRLNLSEERRRKKDKKPKKVKWKKARKFFRHFIKPILDFVPRFLNSIANLFTAVRA